MHVRAKKCSRSPHGPGRRLRCADVAPPSRGAGVRLARLGRARSHVTYAAPRTYTALPLRQSCRNAPHPRVHSTESSFFFFCPCFFFFRNVSSCPIYMINVFVAKPWRVAVSLQRRIMMRRARALEDGAQRVMKNGFVVCFFCFAFFFSPPPFEAATTTGESGVGWKKRTGRSSHMGGLSGVELSLWCGGGL